MIEILRGRSWQLLPEAKAERLDGKHYTLTLTNLPLSGRRRYDDKTFRIDGVETTHVAVSEHESGSWRLDAWVG